MDLGTAVFCFFDAVFYVAVSLLGWLLTLAGYVETAVGLGLVRATWGRSAGGFAVRSFEFLGCWSGSATTGPAEMEFGFCTQLVQILSLLWFLKRNLGRNFGNSVARQGGLMVPSPCQIFEDLLGCYFEAVPCALILGYFVIIYYSLIFILLVIVACVYSLGTFCKGWRLILSDSTWPPCFWLVTVLATCCLLVQHYM